MDKKDIQYGITSQGPNIKRLDTILEELHDGLSKKWGVNTRQNPQSLINHVLTNVADRIAELWEFGESVYYSWYPSTAEGASLDNVAQLGGSIRQGALKSFYPIHCTGIEGTVLSPDTLISSNTNPAIQLRITEQKTITRKSFNKVIIRLAETKTGNEYWVEINKHRYSFNSTDEDGMNILNGLKDSVDELGFTLKTYITENSVNVLEIDCDEISKNNELELSANLTTENVTSVINFGTIDTGDILIPNETIVKIVKADFGLKSVVNICDYIAGRNDENDVEFRQSYIDKIFNRSSLMLESIKSAILENVQGIHSVSGYENYSDETDEYGRPGHSIEFVVDGGDSVQIAKQILNHKAGGISTFGEQEVVLPGINEEEITIRFNRPELVELSLIVTVHMKEGELLTESQSAHIKEIAFQNIGSLEAGEDVVPQKFISKLYDISTGISYIDMDLEDISELPDDKSVYKSITIKPRQKAIISAENIEVNVT